MQTTLKNLAKEAKKRLKSGFWTDYRRERQEKLTAAKEFGLNTARTERYLTQQVTSSLQGEKEDDFYLRVKTLLEAEGEVSNAIGRLTDFEYYDSLTYEEKQRYSLDLSEKYLRALERFRREKEFELIKSVEK